MTCGMSYVMAIISLLAVAIPMRCYHSLMQMEGRKQSREGSWSKPSACWEEARQRHERKAGWFAAVQKTIDLVLSRPACSCHVRGLPHGAGPTHSLDVPRHRSWGVQVSSDSPLGAPERLAVHAAEYFCSHEQIAWRARSAIWGAGEVLWLPLQPVFWQCLLTRTWDEAGGL